MYWSSFRRKYDNPHENIIMIERTAVATITILPSSARAQILRWSHATVFCMGGRPGLLASAGNCTRCPVACAVHHAGRRSCSSELPRTVFDHQIDWSRLSGLRGLQDIFYPQPSPSSAALMKELDAIDALRTGFFTNALNPKTTLFVVSVYTQIVQPENIDCGASGLWIIHVTGALGVVQPGDSLFRKNICVQRCCNTRSY